MKALLGYPILITALTQVVVMAIALGGLIGVEIIFQCIGLFLG
jgi:hypothetical protein